MRTIRNNRDTLRSATPVVEKPDRLLAIGGGTAYLMGMSILCFLGRHKPSQASMARGRDGRYVALCETCACPLERDESLSWRASAPLVQRSNRAA